MTSRSTRSRLRSSGEAPGELNAAPQALEDLEARQLRVLHDRSFIDDPTRLLRLARYAGRLGFAVEPHTRELASAAIEAGALGTVSGSRAGAELRLLAREQDPVRALLALNDLGLDHALHPGLRAPDEALARRALSAAAARRRGRTGSRWALAARGVPAAELPALLDSLAFEAEDRDAIVAIATRAGEVARGLETRGRSFGDRAPRSSADRRSWWRWPGRSVPSARPASGSSAFATSASRSTGATCSRPACPRARRSGAGCARRWPPSSTAVRPTASRGSSRRR